MSSSSNPANVPPSAQSVAMARALGLPEIRILIGDHLPPYSLQACVLVSRGWRASFLPSVWRTLHIDSRGANPSDETLNQYKTLVHEIVLSNRRKSLLGITHQLPHTTLSIRGWTHLTSLTIDVPVVRYPDGPDPKGWNILAEFIKAHPNNLENMQVVLTKSGPPVPALWEAIAACARLRRLHVSKGNICLEEAQAFVDACRLCQSHLELHVVTLPEGIDLEAMIHSANAAQSHPRSNRSVEPKRVVWGQNFGSHTTFGQNIELLQLMPDLTALDIWDSLMPTDRFCQVFSTGAWPKLDSFRLKYARLTDDQMSVILDSMAPCKVWSVSGDFGRLAFGSMKERHFETLVSLDFAERGQSTFDGEISGSMIQGILEGCPRLETFVAKTISASRIESGQLWVCTRLRSLAIDIVMSKEPTEADADQGQGQDRTLGLPCQNRVVFERLATLTCLEELNLRVWRPELDANDGCLQFRLDKGLDTLKGLKRMRNLNTGGKQAIEVPEVEWMVKHWPELETVRGNMHSQRPMLYETMKAMEGHKIKCLVC